MFKYESKGILKVNRFCQTCKSYHPKSDIERADEKFRFERVLDTYKPVSRYFEKHVVDFESTRLEIELITELIIFKQLYKKHLKKQYAGKPTKKYLRLTNQIKKADSIPVEAIEQMMIL